MITIVTEGCMELSIEVETDKQALKELNRIKKLKMLMFDSWLNSQTSEYYRSRERKARKWDYWPEACEKFFLKVTIYTT